MDTGLEEVDMGIQLQKDPDLALLLNFNQVPGGDADDYLDESSYNHAPIRTGSAYITTAQKKFGDASVYLQGSMDNITVPGHSAFDFGTDDFTMDFFIRFYSLTPTLSPFLTSENYYVTGKNGNFTFRLSATGWPNVGVNFATYDGRSNYEGGSYSFGEGVLVTNQWYHAAVVRANNVCYLFWDGVKLDEFALTKALIDAKNGFNIGYWAGNNTYAWIDAYRITKRALWTADFTPPAKESRGYRTDSPTAESPWVSSGKGTLDATTPIFIEENKLAALLGYIGYGTLKYQYALNSGSYNGTWLTLAQLQSALAGQAITVQTDSLRLRVQFHSDGGEAIDISGFGSHVEGGSPGADFLLPLEALDISTEREAADISTEYEVIES